ncbi:hypothetical protein, conserved [Trypanosoma brucei brucei TREU927]|uniref:Uncharacterized protein n=2 Tax=Trypanosoma brucei TaxID=5691 RepID=Q584Y7_TRYB2|nr:hypothetical protein, conserved [Trypanosoma brucei brucei TREU927]AAX79935.1 hypothetical protein, conserved [Trypanosoma brucei]AAZ11906.1 hypothetical protein, conserved [Trypanosoma brucei brucei TREU927]
MFLNNNMVDDARTVQLLEEIDVQLERWGKKYGLDPSNEKQKRIPTAGGGDIKPSASSQRSHDVPNVKFVNDRTNSKVGIVETAAVAAPQGFDPSALFDRIDMLEKKLKVAEEERMILSERLFAAERIVVEVVNAQKGLQDEWAALSTQSFSISHLDDDRRTIVDSGKTSKRDCAFTSYTTQSRQSTQSGNSSVAGLSAFVSPAKEDTSRSCLQSPVRNAGSSGSVLGGEEEEDVVGATERRLFALDDLAQRLAV